jgi:hypothetical protein
MVIVRN